MNSRPAPKLIFWPFILAIAVLIHVDWHLARPNHHALSFEWPKHWIFALVIFGAAGRYAAYRWHGRGWGAPLANLAAALVLGQGVEPPLENLYFSHRLAYPEGAERWHAFFLAIAAGIPAFLIMYGLMRARFRPPPPAA